MIPPNPSCVRMRQGGAPPRLLISVGEPAGIGPDLCVALQAERYPDAVLTLLGDPLVLAQRASQLGIRFQPHLLDEASPTPLPGVINLWPVHYPVEVVPGRLDVRNARQLLQALAQGVQACLAGDYAALVTAPVHKGVINDAGHAFTGHTEYIAELSGGWPVMMLTAPGLRVALVTTHIPLSRVSDAVTPDLLERVIRIVEKDLRQRYHIPRPLIAVCGLNPHAGEGGHLGDEEIRIIQPVLDRLAAEGLALEGAFPADTIFVPEHMRRYDAVLAMYHDQGLPVLKHMGFGQAVNVTLGLPVIRTSVDHGTALDRAGRGNAHAGSLHAAITAALDQCVRPAAEECR